MSSGTDYVLGVNDEEIARLGLQHRAWRAYALAAWESARICPGQTVVDLGCGPGHAALDLAEAVGPQGRVVAIDKSHRFLQVLESMGSARGLSNITTHHVDLESGEFPRMKVHRVWCRWVLSFVRNPREVLEKAAAALHPGGAIVLHEYSDYSTWRAAPCCTELDEFVAAVMASWRQAGGDPDVALRVPAWLEELEFELKEVRPIVDIVTPGDHRWLWLRAFIQSGTRRLIELGCLSAARAQAIRSAFEALESTPGSRMITPAVLQIVARRPQ